MDIGLKETLNHLLGPAVVVVLANLGIGIGLIYSIHKFFKFVEEMLAEDIKNDIATWLLTASEVQGVVRTWPNVFADTFERVFGSQQFSWKCLKACFVLSFCLSWAVQGLWFLVRPVDLEAFISIIKEYLPSTRLAEWILLPLILASIVIFGNAIPAWWVSA